MQVTTVLDVEFIEEEIINVNFTTVDVIQDRGYIVQTVKDCFIFNEVPTQLTVRRFRVSEVFIIESLQVLYNGLKEKNITVHSTTEFSLPIDSIANDTVEVSYIKQ